MIWPIADPDLRSTYRAPRPVGLDAAFHGHGPLEDYLTAGYRKAKVALDLVRSLAYLYPGPWIQRNLNPQTVCLIPSPNQGPKEAPGHAYIHCGLSQNWESTNSVWQHFQSFNGEMEDFPEFFLSLAELLVHIHNSETARWPATNTQAMAARGDWCNALRDTAHELIQDQILKYYGEAIRGCLDFSFDYNNERERQQHRHPSESAQTILRNRILDNLKKHFHFWEAQYSARLLSQSTEPTAGPTAGVIESFYTLFSGSDDMYEDM